MTLPRWIAVPLCLLLLTGCDGPMTLRQRLVGEWVGRPESGAERVLREWPGRRGADGQVDPEDPGVVAAVEKAPATDLEVADAVEVQMQIRELGGAEMTLVGETPLEGTWTLEAVEGRRAQLEIAIAIEDEDDPLRRRFEIEFLREGEGFVMHESGADPRFGRLLFSPKNGSPATAATPKPPTPPVPSAAE